MELSYSRGLTHRSISARMIRVIRGTARSVRLDITQFSTLRALILLQKVAGVRIGMIRLDGRLGIDGMARLSYAA
jgi:hypothetical protein